MIARFSEYFIVNASAVSRVADWQGGQHSFKRTQGISAYADVQAVGSEDQRFQTRPMFLDRREQVNRPVRLTSDLVILCSNARTLWRAFQALLLTAISNDSYSVPAIPSLSPLHPIGSKRASNLSNMMKREREESVDRESDMANGTKFQKVTQATDKVSEDARRAVSQEQVRQICKLHVGR